MDAVRTPPAVSIPHGQRASLVERVAASSRFSKSPSLRRLFLFLCERALGPEPKDLKEHDIGVEFFGREAGYDTANDNVVRVSVSQLRKRLDAYFADEGSGEPLAVRIPRYQYTPVFELRPAVPVNWWSRMRWPLPLAALGVLGLGAWLWTARQAARADMHAPETNRLRGFWSHFTGGGRQTDIVLADASIGMLQDLMGRTLPLSSYLSRRYIGDAQALSGDRAFQTLLARVVGRRATHSEEVDVVRRILQAPGLDRAQLSLVPAADFKARNAKSHNIVLIGGRRSNPWIELFEPEMNFVIEIQDNSKRVLNRNPLPGEQAVYEVARAATVPFGYGLVAYLPNLAQTGSVLIISGTDLGAVEAAADFVTEGRWLSTIMKERQGKPAYFELLVAAKWFDRSAVERKKIAVRYR